MIKSGLSSLLSKHLKTRERQCLLLLLLPPQHLASFWAHSKTQLLLLNVPIGVDYPFLQYLFQCLTHRLKYKVVCTIVSELPTFSTSNGQSLHLYARRLSSKQQKATLASAQLTGQSGKLTTRSPPARIIRNFRIYNPAPLPSVDELRVFYTAPRVPHWAWAPVAHSGDLTW